MVDDMARQTIRAVVAGHYQRVALPARTQWPVAILSVEHKVHHGSVSIHRRCLL